MAWPYDNTLKEKKEDKTEESGDAANSNEDGSKESETIKSTHLEGLEQGEHVSGEELTETNRSDEGTPQEQTYDNDHIEIAPQEEQTYDNEHIEIASQEIDDDNRSAFSSSSGEENGADDEDETGGWDYPPPPFEGVEQQSYSDSVLESQYDNPPLPSHAAEVPSYNGPILPAVNPGWEERLRRAEGFNLQTGARNPKRKLLRKGDLYERDYKGRKIPGTQRDFSIKTSLRKSRSPSDPPSPPSPPNPPSQPGPSLYSPKSARDWANEEADDVTRLMKSMGLDVGSLEGTTDVQCQVVETEKENSADNTEETESGLGAGLGISLGEDFNDANSNAVVETEQGNITGLAEDEEEGEVDEEDLYRLSPDLEPALPLDPALASLQQANAPAADVSEQNPRGFTREEVAAGNLFADAHFELVDAVAAIDAACQGSEIAAPHHQEAVSDQAPAESKEESQFQQSNEQIIAETREEANTVPELSEYHDTTLHQPALTAQEVEAIEAQKKLVHERERLKHVYAGDGRVVKIPNHSVDYLLDYYREASIKFSRALELADREFVKQKHEADKWRTYAAKVKDLAECERQRREQEEELAELIKGIWVPDETSDDEVDAKSASSNYSEPDDDSCPTRLKRKTKEADKLRERLQECHEHGKNLRRDKRALVKAGSRSKGAIEDLQAYIQTLQKKLEEQTALVAKLNAEIDDLLQQLLSKGKLEDSKKLCKELEQKNASLMETAEVQRRVLRSQPTNLSQECEDLLAEKDAEIEKLKKQLSDEWVQELIESMDSAHPARNEITRLTKQFRKQVKETALEHEDATKWAKHVHDKEIKALKAQLEEESKARATAEQERDDISARLANSPGSTSDQFIEALETQPTAEGQQDQTAEENSRPATHQSDKSTQTDDAVAPVSQEERDLQTITDQSEQIQRLNHEIQELEQRLQETTEELAKDQTTRFNEIDDELHVCLDEKAEDKKTIEDLEQQLIQVRKTSGELYDEAKLAKEGLEACKSHVAEFKEFGRVQHRKINMLQKQCDFTRKTCSCSLQEETVSKKLAEAVETLEAQVEQLGLENLELANARDEALTLTLVNSLLNAEGNDGLLKTPPQNQSRRPNRSPSPAKPESLSDEDRKRTPSPLPQPSLASRGVRFVSPPGVRTRSRTPPGEENTPETVLRRRHEAREDQIMATPEYRAGMEARRRARTEVEQRLEEDWMVREEAYRISLGWVNGIPVPTGTDEERMQDLRRIASSTG